MDLGNVAKTGMVRYPLPKGIDGNTVRSVASLATTASAAAPLQTDRVRRMNA